MSCSSFKKINIKLFLNLLYMVLLDKNDSDLGEFE